MKKKYVALVSIIGSATICYVVINIYRYMSIKRQLREEQLHDDYSKQESKDSDIESQDQLKDNNDKLAVSPSDSKNSFESFDEDIDLDFSDQTSCSEISCLSAYSTESNDHGPFPVGEISTYGENIDSDCQIVDFHDILNSPVIDNNITDIRMSRSPASPEVIFYDIEDKNIPDGVEERLQSIVLTYHSIVPPLKPNTGEIIPVPKLR